jgi:uncharacterized membrane protein
MITYKKTITHFLLFLCLTIAAGSTLQYPVKATQLAVRAILFYSPACGHCHQVINEVLPPLFEKYGNQLIIIGVNIQEEAGNSLYQAVITHFTIPADRRGVPTLVVGDTVLVGGYEIPSQFPGIIENGLAASGIGWPDIPGLGELLAEVQPEETEDPAGAGVVAFETLDWRANFLRDRVGNTISLIVLLGLVAVTARVIFVWHRKKKLGAKTPSWVIPAISIFGIAVAAYLAFVETTQTTAICGPIGDCNTVQQSPYATLFGFLPVGVLGVIGYIGILAIWIINYYGPTKLKHQTSILLWGMAILGVLFSIYLTFLEPFVIGATCMWCISSSVMMGILLWVTTNSGVLAVKRLSKTH